MMFQVVLSKDEVAMIDGESGREWVMLKNPPVMADTGVSLKVDYRCATPSKIGVDLMVRVHSGANVLVWQNIWDCVPQADGITTTGVLAVGDFPSSLAYRPSHNNKGYLMSSEASLRVWILDNHRWTLVKKRTQYYNTAGAKMSKTTSVRAPYDRPLRPDKQCHDLVRQISLDKRKGYAPVCAIEPGKVYPCLPADR